MFWPIVSYLSNRYEGIFTKQKLTISFFRIIFSSLIMVLLFTSLATIIDFLKLYKTEFQISYSYGFFIKILYLNFLLTSLCGLILNKISKNINKVKKWLFIGSDKNLELLNKSIKNSNYHKKLKIEKIKDKGIKHLKNSRIIIDHEDKIEQNLFTLIDSNIENILILRTIEDWYEETFERIPVDLFTLNNMYELKQRSYKNNIHNKIKRIGDILLSIFILIITSPLIIWFSFLIWVEDRGPIFYIQKRVGFKGKIFSLVKFRSMHINAEKDGPQWATKNDPRTTFIGKIIRKTRFDEIPQLFSVIKGEMSLIGPRPERPEIENFLKKNINHYNLKYLVKPGMSGWAQVNYPYGSSIQDSKNKLSFDIFYIKNKSLFLDFIVLIKTIKIILNFKKYGSN
tara:strand:- start:1121 stop:2314 length:1194 start_codon:yes stop_codon:yes gene_type:complete